MDFLRLLIQRPVFTSMLILALVVFGVVAYPKIGVDQFPEVEFPVVTVLTTLPGADPETIERDVTKVLEDAVSTISGIDTLRSINVESVSQLIIVFDLEKPVALAAQEVRDQIAAKLGDLPDEADPPVVQKADIGAAPVMILAMSGTMPIEQLTDLAENQARDALQQAEGVGAVDVIGGRQREIRVVLKPERLRFYGLAVNDVSAALKSESLDAPAGRTTEPERERVVRLMGEVRSADEVGNLIVRTSGAIPVYVRDVADVIDGAQEARSMARFNGRSAVAFAIRKQSGANTVKTADAIRGAMINLQHTLPAGVELQVVNDGAKFIRASIHSVQEDLVLGAVLAVMIVLVFLRNGRSTIIAAVALPTSVVGTFMVMRGLNFTFNSITMLALTLSIGLLIDDAIVVIENIVRHLEEGKTPMQAAYEGTRQIAVAVLAVTLAIVAVFVPVAFMEGMIGRFFYQFGVTVAVAVLISYAVSMSLTPVMASRILRQHHGQPGRLNRFIERGLIALESGYARALAGLLNHRGITMAVAVVILVGTVMLVPLLKTAFLPRQDQSAMDISLELPQGTPLATTMAAVEEIAAQVRDYPGVAGVFTSVGGGVQQKVNLGSVFVNLVGKAERPYTQMQLQARLRNSLRRPQGSILSVKDPAGASGSRSEPVQFNLRGSDWDELVRSAEKLQAAMRQHGGFVDVDTDYRGGSPQLNVRVDRLRAASLGVHASTIGGSLRAFFGGDAVAHFRAGEHTYDITLALPEAVRGNPAMLDTLAVRGDSGQLVELRNITQVREGEGPGQINRGAKQREITLFANLDTLSLGEAMGFLRDYGDHSLPKSVTWQFDGQAKNQRKSGAAFKSALILALVLVYMILAAQFESLLDPVTIMMSLPFAVIGAIGSLLLTGEQLSIFATIGVIMLMGLVTKNGILLVEFARQAREGGAATREALIESGRVRLRPILMTSVAMIAGMVPAAIARGDGAEQRVPMAVVIIGGLISSTFLTLGVVPVVYSLFDAARERLARIVGRGPAPASGEVH